MKKETLPPQATTEDRWNKAARELLQGRTIVKVGYMSEEEAEAMGWSARPIVIELDNGLLLYPSMDDEGNDGGALFTSDEKTPGLPVLR